MDLYEVPLNEKLWKEFLSIQKDPSIFYNYRNYFSALCCWVKDNRKLIPEDIFRLYRLSSIINLDAEEWVSENPEISLELETKRMFENRPDTIGSLMMRINDTLWDLARKPSGIDCPQCIYDELNYVVGLVKESKGKKIFLECDSCGYTQNLDDTNVVEEIEEILPASKKYLRQNGISI